MMFAPDVQFLNDFSLWRYPPVVWPRSRLHEAPSNDTDKLLARATKAIAESRQLVEQNPKLQADIYGGLRRMSFRITPRRPSFFRRLTFLVDGQSISPFLTRTTCRAAYHR